jgi:hypothetical protein
VIAVDLLDGTGGVNNSQYVEDAILEASFRRISEQEVGASGFDGREVEFPLGVVGAGTESNFETRSSERGTSQEGRESRPIVSAHAKFDDLDPGAG